MNTDTAAQKFDPFSEEIIAAHEKKLMEFAHLESAQATLKAIGHPGAGVTKATTARPSPMPRPSTFQPLDDAAHSGEGAGWVDEPVLPERPPDEATDDDKAQVKDSLASQLVAFVLERVELFHDDNRESFAMVNSGQETHRLNSTRFKSWLMAEFYKATGKAGRDQSVREAMQVLDGMAQHDGEQKTVHLRVAKMGDAVLVDLAQPGNSLAAKIEAGSWALVQQHEVRFIRPDTMRPLPTPAAGAGGIDLLWQFVNVPEGSRLLVLAWLLEALRPDGVFPVLELLGEAGSAKSTTQKYLRMLIDPNASNLRSPPKSVEDVFVSAGVNWVVSFENVSHLTPPMQDAMCVLATGGGFAKRKLYSDGEESVINVTRPIVINGISACVTAHDLIDRSICVEPQRIQTRREDGEIQREFEAAHPSLVAGLFDLMAQTLKALPHTQLPSSENIRMAGFARLGMAMQRAMGQPEGEFLRQFHAARQESIARTIDSSPVATALLEWFESRQGAGADMAVKALFSEVDRFKPLGAEAWPRSPKGFADALRRAAPSLRYMGVDVKSLGKVGGAVKWSVRSCREKSYGPEGEEDTPPDPAQGARGYLSNPCPASPDVLARMPKNPIFAEKIGKKPPKAGREQDMQDMQDIDSLNIPRCPEAVEVRL